MSLTGVLLRHDSQAEIAIMKLEQNCMGGGRAGWGPVRRLRSPKARCEGGAQGFNSGSQRRSDVAQCRD